MQGQQKNSLFFSVRYSFYPFLCTLNYEPQWLTPGVKTHNTSLRCYILVNHCTAVYLKKLVCPCSQSTAPLQVSHLTKSWSCGYTKLMKNRRTNVTVRGVHICYRRQFKLYGYSLQHQPRFALQVRMNTYMRSNYKIYS